MQIFITNTKEPNAYFLSRLENAEISNTIELPDYRTFTILYEGSAFDREKRIIESFTIHALDVFKESLPVDEKIETYRLGMITNPPETYQKNCPVLEIKTSHADYLLVYEQVTLLEDETLDVAADSFPLLVGNPVVMFFLKEIAKGLFKAGAEKLYREIYSIKDVDIQAEIGKLKNEIINFLKEIQYENIENEFISIYRWLQTTHDSLVQSYLNKEDVNCKEIFDLLKVKQTELQKICSIFEVRITDEDMKSCDYLIRAKVLLYATSATLRIQLMREQLFWQSILKANKEPGFNNNAVLNELKEFIKTVDKNINHYIAKLKDGRLNKITDVHEITKTGWTWMSVGGIPYYGRYTNYFMAWDDEFESNVGVDKFKGDKIHESEFFYKNGDWGKDKNTAKEKMEKQRQEHYDIVERLFKEHIQVSLESISKRLKELMLQPDIQLPKINESADRDKLIPNK